MTAIPVAKTGTNWGMNWGARALAALCLVAAAAPALRAQTAPLVTVEGTAQTSPGLALAQQTAAPLSRLEPRLAPPAPPTPPLDPGADNPYTDTLTLNAILSSSARHFPAILESLAKRDAAGGKALSALGAFDLVFSTDAKHYATGCYDGRVVGSEARKNLRTLGATVYSTYRLSDGDFPVYEDRNFTNTGGEAAIGFVISLLRDRAIDDRRFTEALTTLGLSEADLSLSLTAIGVQHRAQIAYWRWIAAGRQLTIYEELLKIAEARQTGLAEQVRRGARAEIFLTENRQNITRRQILATEARQAFMKASIDLSFYWRDANGSPATPTRSQLPPTPPISRDLASAIAQDLEAPNADNAEAIARQRRPELALVDVEAERAVLARRLGRNDLLPKFDLVYELLHDFGDVAEGGISRDSTDNIIGFKFSVPLERRKARGDIQAAEANLEAARQKARRLQDQIDIEIRSILLELDMARQLTILAAQEVDQSQIMEQAERRRFAGGASDFFLVNIREETAADAAIRFHTAELKARIARANFDAATVNRDRLGLTGAGF